MNSTTAASQIAAQWANPSDIFSLLLLVGGDVIQKSLAQFHAYRVRPVAFSFGWVAYAFTALLAAVARLKVMPDPDCPAILIDCRQQQRIENQSWLLGRLLRAHHSWKSLGGTEESSSPEMGREGPVSASASDKFRGTADNTTHGRKGLTVYVYETVAEDKRKPGVPRNDLAYYSGFAVTLVQLGIAAIPIGLYLEWEIFAITAAGSLLAYANGYLFSLSQGTPRKLSTKTSYVLVQPGTSEAVVIKMNPDDMRLDDLANIEGGAAATTVLGSAILLVLWASLLITVSGLKNHTWFIVAVGATGMLQNILIAGTPRAPDTMGIHLRSDDKISGRKFMQTLMNLEIRHRRTGAALLPVYPLYMRKSEREWWERASVINEDHRGEDPVHPSEYDMLDSDTFGIVA